MHHGLWLKVFSYQVPYHKLQAKEILEDMMNSPDVQAQFRVSTTCPDQQLGHNNMPLPYSQH